MRLRILWFIPHPSIHLKKLQGMKYLIVGLGNIGDQYQHTRHNIGFEILDVLANKHNLCFKGDRFGSICVLKHKGRKLILLKPDTYMNLSGKAVNFWMQKENILIDKVLIITDDLSLPFGKIRLRAKGSDGGHNGLKNIIEVLGGQNFPRLRFGISNDFSKGLQVDYVLGIWGEEELKSLTERIDICTDTIKDFSFIRFDQLMSTYNSK